MQDLPLDAADLRILRALQQQGRISNVELAQAAHLSTAQCNRRHRRLEEAGLVRGYEARLDRERLGWGVLAIIHVSMERGHFSEIRKFRAAVAAMEQIQECYAVTGDSDYVLKVVARDLRALSDFVLGKVMQLPGVGGVRSNVCLDEIKSTGALPLER
ncbi:MAG: Lrp/AsnC family transcriptional regulator [Burkholderiales bacterium]|nr:Lrp/AsnC family transcriptional regulator [Burkholderiales bacterium]MDE2396110.1 Lrp/AsnC family transcriptional regulator [Burkholderiales bacterium]MDE2454057.1 Lrp/AsnC family transcriptional regulator [Burkholderiales bacterium]